MQNSGIPNGIDVDAFKQIFVDMGFTVQQVRIIQDTMGTGFSAGTSRGCPSTGPLNVDSKHTQKQTQYVNTATYINRHW